MKKIFNILVILIVILIPIGVIKYDGFNFVESNNEISQVEQIQDNNIVNKGMKITMLGGSNMKDKDNLNSMGYLIRTSNDKLIVVDGGRKTDAELLMSYIDKYGNGQVDCWFLTHGHGDHSGALVEILNSSIYDVKIENLYYSLNTKEWYNEHDERGKEAETALLDSLSNSKIINQTQCEEGQTINIDNIECEIIRVSNPQIINSDNGNEASMVFKLTAKDVGKSMLFLGDAYIEASKELLEKKEKLSSYAVQMAHHGQNGVTEEVYDCIKPSVCFFNAPDWLYNNDAGDGYNTGNWKSIIVQEWMKKYNTTNYKAYEGDQVVYISEDGAKLLDE